MIYSTAEVEKQDNKRSSGAEQTVRMDREIRTIGHSSILMPL
jgi:hypothetical protein